MTLINQITCVGNIVHAEIIEHNGQEFLGVTLGIQDAKDNQARYKFTTTRKLYEDFKAGINIIGDRVTAMGTVDVTRIANAYAKNDEVFLLKYPTIRLNYVTCERVSKRDEQAKLVDAEPQLLA